MRSRPANVDENQLLWDSGNEPHAASVLNAGALTPPQGHQAAVLLMRSAARPARILLGRSNPQV